GLVSLHREEFSFLGSVLPAIVAVGLGGAARFLSVPKPWLCAFRLRECPHPERCGNRGCVFGWREGRRIPRAQGSRVGRTVPWIRNRRPSGTTSRAFHRRGIRGTRRATGPRRWAQARPP